MAFNINNQTVDNTTTTIQDGILTMYSLGGGTVLISSGTFTENLQLYNGVYLESEGGAGSTIIIGIHTPPTSGYTSISNITLQNAGDIIYSTAAGTAQIDIINCEINITTSGYIFDLPNWTGVILLNGMSEISSGTNNLIYNTGGFSNITIENSFFNTISGAAIITGCSDIYINSSTIYPAITFTSCTGYAVISSFASSLTLSTSSSFDFNQCNITGVISLDSTSASQIFGCVFDTASNPVITGNGTLTIGGCAFIQEQGLANTLIISDPVGFMNGPFGTANYVWSSNGAGVAPSWKPVSSSGGVMELTGNSGIATPSTGNINIIDSQGTGKFTGSGSTITHTYIGNNVNLAIGSNLSALTTGVTNTVFGTSGAGNALTSANSTCIFGNSSGFAINSGSLNNIFGSGSAVNLNTGSNNCIFGTSVAVTLLTGTRNVLLGNANASNYTGAESSNILIGSSITGSTGESNILRIGNATGSSAGNINAAYICGIQGTNVGSTATVVTTAGTNTNQLGSAVITGGTGVTITPGANTITISATATGFTWHDVTGGSATLAASNGYIADSASLTTFTLPTNNAFGDTIQIVGKGTGLWKIVYGTGQNIVFGSSTSTTTTGNITSTNAGDCINLVCTTASATAPIFTVVSSIGSPSIT